MKDAHSIGADALAALHAAAFDGPARWSAAAFASALDDARCFLLTEGGGWDGFGLGREVAGEAELMTLLVVPGRRRRGLGRGLLAAFEAAARERGAGHAFLEVSVRNEAARALYAAAGWRTLGRRVGYYEGVDALTYGKDL